MDTHIVNLELREWTAGLWNAALVEVAAHGQVQQDVHDLAADVRIAIMCAPALLLRTK